MTKIKKGFGNNPKDATKPTDKDLLEKDGTLAAEFAVVVMISNP